MQGICSLNHHYRQLFHIFRQKTPPNLHFFEKKFGQFKKKNYLCPRNV